jgi:tRNA(adenine34) deaminase
MARPAEAEVRYMARCLELAELARESGNTPVGALLVLKRQIVVEASEAVPAGARPFAHAELLVVEKALAAFGRNDLLSATLYSSAEPCLFCSFAIREAGVGRVVLGRSAGEIGGVDGCFPVLSTKAVSRWGAPPQILRWEMEAE